MGLLCAKTVKAWHGFESCPVIVSFLPGHVKFFCGSRPSVLRRGHVGILTICLGWAYLCYNTIDVQGRDVGGYHRSWRI